MTSRSSAQARRGEGDYENAPLTAARRPEKWPIDLILGRCEPEPNTGCMLWTGPMDKDGYGSISLFGKPYRLHRLVFQIATGPIPDGLVIDHWCNTRLCVNPNHLRLLTLGANVLRGQSPCAKHARQTHCKYGHPYEGPNLIIEHSGSAISRRCRTCKHLRDNARRQRLRREARLVRQQEAKSA